MACRRADFVRYAHVQTCNAAEYNLIKNRCEDYVLENINLGRGAGKRLSTCIFHPFVRSLLAYHYKWLSASNCPQSSNRSFSIFPPSHNIISAPYFIPSPPPPKTFFPLYSNLLLHRTIYVYLYIYIYI